MPALTLVRFDSAQLIDVTVRCRRDVQGPDRVCLDVRPLADSSIELTSSSLGPEPMPLAFGGSQRLTASIEWMECRRVSLPVMGRTQDWARVVVTSQGAGLEFPGRASEPPLTLSMSVVERIVLRVGKATISSGQLAFAACVDDRTATPGPRNVARSLR